MVYTVGNMSGGKNRGYTIVEVMIFLAISGVMFIMAAIFISSKQAAAQFGQGLNGLASQLQSTIQEVSDGQYTTLDTLSCNSAVTSLTLGTSSTTGQGTNGDCVFLGKLVQFKPSNTSWSGADNPLHYLIIPVAGDRTKVTDDLNGTLPTLLYKSDGTLDALTSNSKIPQNLAVDMVSAIDSTNVPHPVYAFGFLANPAVQSGKLQNGAQSVGLYYVDGVGADQSEETLRAAVASGKLTRAVGAAICFKEGSRQAAIIIGMAPGSSSASQLSVTIDRAHGEAACS